MPLEHIDPPTLMKPMGYTHVVAATGARTLYVAGQGAFDAQWQLVGPGDLEAQARQAYGNLLLALEGAGAGPEHIAKSTMYVVGLEQAKLPAVMRGIAAALGGRDARPPASTMVGVERLAMDGMLIEIEAIAVVDA
ncbi:MAG: RidA family protein [Myxococcota bacterium]|nr:RidA family protein [Myxococcales bacterium]